MAVRRPKRRYHRVPVLDDHTGAPDTETRVARRGGTPVTPGPRPWYSFGPEVTEKVELGNGTHGTLPSRRGPVCPHSLRGCSGADGRAGVSSLTLLSPQPLTGEGVRGGGVLVPGCSGVVVGRDTRTCPGPVLRRKRGVLLNSDRDFLPVSQDLSESLDVRLPSLGSHLVLVELLVRWHVSTPGRRKDGSRTGSGTVLGESVCRRRFLCPVPLSFVAPSVGVRTGPGRVVGRRLGDTPGPRRTTLRKESLGCLSVTKPLLKDLVCGKTAVLPPQSPSSPLPSRNLDPEDVRFAPKVSVPLSDPKRNDVYHKE